MTQTQGDLERPWAESGLDCAGSVRPLLLMTLEGGPAPCAALLDWAVGWVPGCSGLEGSAFSRPPCWPHWTQWEALEGRTLGEASGPQGPPLSAPGDDPAQNQPWRHWIFILLTKGILSLAPLFEKHSL